MGVSAVTRGGPMSATFSLFNHAFGCPMFTNPINTMRLRCKSYLSSIACGSVLISTYTGGNVTTFANSKASPGIVITTAGTVGGTSNTKVPAMGP